MAVTEQKIREQSVLEVARKMMICARTAPKGRGVDNLEISLLSGDELKKLAGKLKALAKKTGMAFFERDANCVLASECVVLLGTKISPLGLAAGPRKCGLCGFDNCAEKLKFKNVPCAFNTGDLGIAAGSAVSIAADCRVDNRIMFSAGMAAMALGFLSKEIKITYAIPLSVSGKNPFFDRVFPK
ncbi:MAG: DUF2148 domain-containing protein [Elusimicrobia bacterium]|nr:DUF2148 domain-containing protein [Elusimicrobiota bacterium]